MKAPLPSGERDWGERGGQIGNGQGNGIGNGALGRESVPWLGHMVPFPFPCSFPFPDGVLRPLTPEGRGEHSGAASLPDVQPRFHADDPAAAHLDGEVGVGHGALLGVEPRAVLDLQPRGGDVPLGDEDQLARVLKLLEQPL